MKFQFLITTAFFMNTSYASIYGLDDRIETSNNLNPKLTLNINAAAAMIENDFIESISINKIAISASLFKDIYHLCPLEKFKDQITASNCSGTLIDKDIILTAGHCFADPGLDCHGYSWVFDYQQDNFNGSKIILPATNAYKCKQIIKKIVDDKNNIDYALIRLDRSVSDRQAAKIRLTGDIKPDETIAAIGTPRGLPLKMAPRGNISVKNEFSFMTNLDTYTMNSGSGVFNEVTGDLEGVLISGALDFKTNTNLNCTQSSIYSQNEGKELVMKIKNIWNDIDLL